VVTYPRRTLAVGAMVCKFAELRPARKDLRAAARNAELPRKPLLLVTSVNRPSAHVSDFARC
jgi:hypothetical protein